MFQVGDPVAVWNEKYRTHFDAKVLAYKEENNTFFIHYVNWNTKHDCWVDERFLSFIGGGTKTLLEDRPYAQPVALPECEKALAKAAHEKLTVPTGKRKRPVRDVSKGVNTSLAQAAVATKDELGRDLSIEVTPLETTKKF